VKARRAEPVTLTCPTCRGAGRLYDTDEAGEPCPTCQEDGWLEGAGRLEVVTEMVRWVRQQPWLVTNDEDRSTVEEIIGKLEHFHPADPCPLCEEVVCDGHCPLASLRPNIDRGGR
jgi:hypothetical protein